MKSQFKSWPTWKLKEIIDENYHRGVNGKDYAVDIEEIQEEYWNRISKNAEKEYEKTVKQINKE